MANIEKHLVINKYLLSLFGVTEFKSMQSELANTQTEIDSEGRTHFSRRINSFSRINREKLPEEKLSEYDRNIVDYTNKISFRRDKINLKYFQYLSVLFSEIIFDNIKHRKQDFIFELNEFLRKYNNENNLDIIEEITENDLKKLAYWMATGSGKTLIMHINYYQFLKYNLFEPDNIILITPNEGLSRQHLTEMLQSGVPAKQYGGTLSGTMSDNEVLIIEITKLVEEKKGGGVSLPVNVFEGKNLILVDEGHKGKSSEEQAWAKLRNKLAENGFVFEYSATFGQILSENAKKKDILKEYAKSIIFDYSYKYFYLDNYGKDFSVMNMPVNKVSDTKFRETMFVANFLSFYEQLIIFNDFNHKARELNLEKPLWIFVGTTVTGKQADSDVLQIVNLIYKMFNDEEWLKDTIERISDENTGLKDENGKDIFSDRLKYIKKKNTTVKKLVKKISGGKGDFEIYEIKNADGELGLKTGENDYFGVINIGDVPGFKKELEKLGIEVKQDSFTTSLFDKIKTDNSLINILIGSKKFIEGWDTWRVSSMGLLNIGSSEGPQIIQLFGRGIRLKGKNYSLKRSAVEEEIKSLETLNIFGIKANYLETFLKAIRNEDLDLEEIEIPVELQHREKWKKLDTLGKDENKKFEEEMILRLGAENPFIVLDLTPKVSVYDASNRTANGVNIKTAMTDNKGLRLHGTVIGILDWDYIMKELYEFKMLRNYWNLVFSKEYFIYYLLSDKYKIIVNQEDLIINSESDVDRVSNIVLSLLKKLIEKLYKDELKRYESDNLKYKKLEEQLPLFVFEKGKNKEEYKIFIDKSEKKKIKEIKDLLKNIEKLLNEEDNVLPRVHFDKHFFLPLLIKDDKIKKFSPPELVESEIKFVKELRDYLKDKGNKYKDYEIYLLRNLPKSGVGFFLSQGFYPDFILWIKGKDVQHIVFIDPKGLRMSREINGEKIQLHKGIKNIEKRENKKNKYLHSFILSDTSYQELIKGLTTPPSKNDYNENNVLFLEDSNWQEMLFEKILK